MRARRPQMALAPWGGQNRPAAWCCCISASATWPGCCGAADADALPDERSTVSTASAAGAAGGRGAGGLPSGSETGGGALVSAVAISSSTACRLARRDEGRLEGLLEGLLTERAPFFPLSACSGLADLVGLAPRTAASVPSPVWSDLSSSSAQSSPDQKTVRTAGECR